MRGQAYIKQPGSPSHSTEAPPRRVTKLNWTVCAREASPSGMELLRFQGLFVTAAKPS